MNKGDDLERKKNGFNDSFLTFTFLSYRDVTCSSLNIILNLPCASTSMFGAPRKGKFHESLIDADFHIQSTCISDHKLVKHIQVLYEEY